MQPVSISQVQGTELNSPYAGQQVRVTGVVTCALRNGFFLQDVTETWDQKRSLAIFVYSPELRPKEGAYVEVLGEVMDYIAHESAKPVTQLILEEFAPVKSQIDYASLSTQLASAVLDFDINVLSAQGQSLADWLNSAEGMLIRIPAMSRFIAPSNKFGDYVLKIPGHDHGLIEHDDGGVVVGEGNELTWFPGFRVTDYDIAQQLDVGSTLAEDIVGALHYRVNAFQVAVSHGFKVDHQFASSTVSRFTSSDEHVRIMTLNCFNLDPTIERADRVVNPRTDIDDDYGDGRFHALAKAIVVYAREPEIVALQEIQDSDGAEQSDVTHAHDTYALLLKAIAQISSVQYNWIDLEPELNADGGQPGGNIRNGFLYRTDAVKPNRASLQKLGIDHPAFVDSRKPLICEFESLASGRSWYLINLHLASKRHQASVFAPLEPGHDHKESVRIAQAEVVGQAVKHLLDANQSVYVTGDFNDGEHSNTLAVFNDYGLKNLVFKLQPRDRFDYNHRGKLQVLMHGLVGGQEYMLNSAEYEILHGNELIGVEPGQDSDKASDHAYVISQLEV